jgi:hypothetical protein
MILFLDSQTYALISTSISKANKKTKKRHSCPLLTASSSFPFYPKNIAKERKVIPDPIDDRKFQE